MLMKLDIPAAAFATLYPFLSNVLRSGNSGTGRNQGASAEDRASREWIDGKFADPHPRTREILVSHAHCGLLPRVGRLSG